MPEADNEGRNYHVENKAKSELFFLKGSNELGWGMKNRLARVFNPKDGKTIMLAIDHGYFQGPTTGLERIDVDIMPLVPYADTLMLTRGILRSIVPPSVTKPIMIRASGGPSILKELSNEEIAMDIEDSIRLGVCGTAIQVFIGGEFESRSVVNMTKLVDSGLRYGIPTMAVTAVGREMARTPKYFRLATRICAELGANIVKTYYTDEDFETVTATCPVPIVIAGGKKRPEMDALEMAYRAIDQGAAGVDMGRNIFQSDSPHGMMQAINAVVHGNAKPKEAFAIYEQVKSGEHK
ncbi:MAG: 3-hydroxy-5-phosphonooxypentane-2,4-dione thiolase [Spirochaetaceae bacterium]|nr:3-hydroxy-5-phosphonooxypentane-2,4-dione thiolase [Spirochaetaceae bacterium]